MGTESFSYPQLFNPRGLMASICALISHLGECFYAGCSQTAHLTLQISALPLAQVFPSVNSSLNPVEAMDFVAVERRKQNRAIVMGQCQG